MTELLLVIIALIAVWCIAWVLFVAAPGGTIILNALAPTLIVISVIAVLFYICAKALPVPQ